MPRAGGGVPSKSLPFYMRQTQPEPGRLFWVSLILWEHQLVDLAVLVQLGHPMSCAVHGSVHQLGDSRQVRQWPQTWVSPFQPGDCGRSGVWEQEGWGKEQEEADDGAKPRTGSVIVSMVRTRMGEVKASPSFWQEM